MNFRNKYLVITVRVLLGLFMVFSGVSGLLAGADSSGVPQEMVEYTQVLWKSGIFQMIKVTELVAGIMLVTGVLPALAAIFLAPVAVGIIVFNARLTPMYLPMGIVVALLTAFLGYAYWDKYRALFRCK